MGRREIKIQGLPFLQDALRKAKVSIDATVHQILEEEFRRLVVMPVSGVVFSAPPERLIPDITASISRAVAALPEGKHTAVVAVMTEVGANAAIVAKVGEDWRVQTWIGKSWGSSHINGGVEVMGSW